MQKYEHIIYNKLEYSGLYVLLCKIIYHTNTWKLAIPKIYLQEWEVERRFKPSKPGKFGKGNPSWETQETNALDIQRL